MFGGRETKPELIACKKCNTRLPTAWKWIHALKSKKPEKNKTGPEKKKDKFTKWLLVLRLALSFFLSLKLITDASKPLGLPIHLHTRRV